MTWRYTKAGREMPRPSSEHGLFIEGPLTSEDWKAVLEDVAQEMIEQAKREATEQAKREQAGGGSS